MDAPLFDLNYGLPDIQLKLEIPIKVVHEDNNGTTAGLGDLLLGVKWRFFNNEKSQLQLAFIHSCCFQVAITRGDWAKVGQHSCCRLWRRRAGVSGRFTET